MQSKFIVLLKRFARTLVAILLGAGATAMIAVTAQFVKGNPPSSLEDLQKLGFSLIPVFGIAFFGAIAAALQKWARWVEPEQPEPLTNEQSQ